MPAREGFRSRGVSKNWEKWMSWEWAFCMHRKLAGRMRSNMYL
jgi:hypothetical protein